MSKKEENMRKRNYFWVLQICFVVCVISFGGTAFGAENIGLFPSSLKELKLCDVKITWGGENRFRYEYQHNFSFDEEGRGGNPMYDRTKFNIKADYNNVAQVFFEGFDVREWHSNNHPRLQEDNFDLHQLYFLLSKPNDLPVSLKIGRQELKYGVGRLVWASPWPNETRSFDAAKITYNPSSFDIDLLVGNQVYSGLVDKNGNKILYENRHFNDAYWGEYLFGLYTTYKGIKDNLFDIYCLNLIDKSHLVSSEEKILNPSERYTLGTRGEGKVLSTALGYGYEFAYQFGKKSSDDIRAYAFHLDLNYALKQIITQPTFKIEYNFATGDKTPKDGTSNTFSPLFQSTHDPYGLIDFFRWQNVKEFAAFMDFVPIKNRINGSLQYHRYYLDDTTDAWYNAAGIKVRQAKAGQHVSDYVGDEVDLRMNYKLFSFLTLEGGYAHFFCGKFVKDTGSSDDADWFYLQTVVTF
jgi:hypothetical protein